MAAMRAMPCTAPTRSRRCCSYLRPRNWGVGLQVQAFSFSSYHSGVSHASVETGHLDEQGLTSLVSEWGKFSGASKCKQNAVRRRPRGCRGKERGGVGDRKWEGLGEVAGARVFHRWLINQELDSLVCAVTHCRRQGEGTAEREHQRTHLCSSASRSNQSKR